MQITKITFIIIFITLLSEFAFSQNGKISFEQQNKNSKYYSFSFGMGAEYSNNPSLVSFVGYELPFYNTLSQNDKLSDYSAGFEAFAGAEFQLKKNISIKAEYSYFSKSINLTSLPQYQNYDFTYVNHQPYITVFYIIPQEYSYLKFGFGAGFLHTIFTEKVYSAENQYTSNGIGFKVNGILDIQISKNLAGYIEGYIDKTFQSDMKDDSGNYLLSQVGDRVNASSLGLGVRIGAEIFIF